MIRQRSRSALRVERIAPAAVVVDSQGVSPGLAGFLGCGIQRDAATVGDSDHALEVGDDCSGVYDSVRSHGSMDRLARFGEIGGATDCCIGKTQQHFAVLDTAIDLVAHRAAEVKCVVILAAPTEQRDV